MTSATFTASKIYHGIAFDLSGTLSGNMEDCGIGSYEFWGSKGCDVDLQFVPDEITSGAISYLSLAGDVESTVEDFKAKNPRVFDRIELDFFDNPDSFQQMEILVEDEAGYDDEPYERHNG